MDNSSTWKALSHRMRQSLDALYRAKFQITGVELSPIADIARHWPTVTGCYSLLEQSLKLLMMMRRDQYDLKYARSFRHNIVQLYDELVDTDRRDLEAFYIEYASMLGAPSLADYPQLSSYLERITMGRASNSKKSGKGYEAWRYCLLEYPDCGLTEYGVLVIEIVFEVIHGVLSIVEKDCYDNRPLLTVSRRLEQSIEDAINESMTLCFQPADEEGAVESCPIPQEVLAGVDKVGSVNLIAQYVRTRENVGADTRDSAPEWHRWLDMSIAYLKGEDNTGQLQGIEGYYSRPANVKGSIYGDSHCDTFLNRAKSVQLFWDTDRFKVQNQLPVRPEFYDVEWRWKSEHTDLRVACRLPVRSIPCTTGQYFKGHWRIEDTGGRPVEIQGSSGELIVYCDGQEATRFPATAFVTGGGVVGNDGKMAVSSWTARFVRNDNHLSKKDLFKQLQREDGDGYDCEECSQTGWCIHCEGCGCSACATPGNGLCSACKGYRKVGYYLLTECGE